MVAPEPKTKIRMVRDCVVPVKTDKGLDWEHPVVRAGAVVEVDAEVAKELCETSFDVQPQYRGERIDSDPENKNKIYRAVRL